MMELIYKNLSFYLSYWIFWNLLSIFMGVKLSKTFLLLLINCIFNIWNYLILLRARLRRSYLRSCLKIRGLDSSSHVGQSLNSLSTRLMEFIFFGIWVWILEQLTPDWNLCSNWFFHIKDTPDDLHNKTQKSYQSTAKLFT